MNILHVIEIIVSALTVVLIAAIGGIIKAMRQLESLETKVETIERDMARQEVEYNKIESLLKEIQVDIKRIELTLAKNQIED